MHRTRRRARCCDFQQIVVQPVVIGLQCAPATTFQLAPYNKNVDNCFFPSATTHDRERTLF